MPIPDREKLKTAIGKFLADGSEHSVEDLRDTLQTRFSVAPHEDSYKLKNGKKPFDKEVNLAFG